ncbi:S-layer family protein [Pseudogulbenkiania sp. MAI-1]|uniref:beta strand repeat-containing protein n=1 Tax=Pseudogulbenkiania sp. MAI-1 TaxID=990370 RepID=UPI00045E7BF9|nr:retention module-containing protein [Pseudogulbenkiania sp. MAI-1]
MAITTQISSQIALSSEARVDTVHGTVRVINAQGQVRLLKAGDIVHAGERIVAEADGSVTLLTASGEPLVIEGGRLVALDEAILNPQTVPDSSAAALQAPSVQQQQVAADTDAILRALEAGQDPFAALAPAAAGLSGAGGEDGGSTFIRLARITEGLTDVGLAASFDIANQEPATLAEPLSAVEQGNGVSIGGLTPAVQGGEGSVRESGLVGGSGPVGETSFTGSFTVTAIDGLDTIVIGGVTIVAGNVQTGNTTITTDLGNTLTITGFDPSTGVVSYTYTLTEAETHAAGGGNNTLFDNVSITAADVDGSSSSGTLSVTIVDDVPAARADSASVTEDGTLTASANVLTNDTLGADTPATVSSVNGSAANVGIAIEGLYGTLTLAANGSYTYSLHNDNAAVQGLSSGEHLTDSFDYVLKDADGDTSPSTLTLTINGADDGVTISGLSGQGADQTVDEDDLAPDGSDQSGSTTVSGSFTVDALDGVTTLTVGGIAVVSGGVTAAFPQSATSPLGNTLTITGFDGHAVSYSYTLLDNASHATGAGENSLTESFAVTLQDSDGDSTSASLDIAITDDVPTAQLDSASVTEDGTLTASANVLSNDTLGADTPATVSSVNGSAGNVGVAIEGLYGTLTLNANGSYTYTLHNDNAAVQGLSSGEHLTDSFDYVLKDADGDTSLSTLTLTINGADDGITITGLNPDGAEGTVDEAALATGSTPSATTETVSGSFTVMALDGLDEIELGGVKIVDNNALTANTTVTPALGNTITITGFDAATGVVSYTYTLTAAETHADGAGNNTLPDSTSLVVRDVDGSTASDTLDISITDDVPVAVDDTGGTVSETSLSFSGTVLSNDTEGADRLAAPVTASTFAGTYGTLTLNGDGTYTYTLHPADPDFLGIPGGESRTETFVYTLNDSDGDTDTATLTLTVHNADDGVTISGLSGQGADQTVDEDDLAPDGSDQSGSTTVSGSFTVDAPDGVTTLTVGGIAVVSGGVTATFPQSATSPLGNTLRITGFDGHTVSYSYTLLDNASHATGSGENSLTENFAVTLQDSDGDETTASLDIAVVDDVPSAFTPDTAHMVDQTDSIHSVTDELNFAGHTGADGVVSVAFNITAGAPALDAYGNQLRLDGAELFLYYGGVDGTDQTQLVAKTAAGAIGFTVDIDPSSDSYTLTTYGIISSGPAEVQVTSLSSIGGGNVTIKGLLNVGGTTQDVILSSTSGTVNTDQDDIGVGGGQTLSSTDNVRLDFVNGLSVGKNDYSYTDHNLVSGFEQVVLINGNANASANLILTAIVADNDQTYGTADGEESQLNLSVSNITVYDADHNVVASGTQGLTITDQGNSILLSGLKDGWSYEITSGDTFSAVNVAGAAGTHTFALGAFSYSQTIPGQPIDLSFGITATDGDGDPVASQIDATLYPSELSLEGDGSVNTLTATLDDSFIFGYGGDDTLDGSLGNAVLVGGDDNDLLIYGIGDTIDGGNGFDTVRIDSAGVLNLGGTPLSDIEQLQMNGASTNTTLQLRPEDVLNFTDRTHDHTLFVRGDSGDTLDLVGVTSPTATGPDITVDGVIYAHYQFDVNGTTVTINVEKAVNVI